MSRRDRVIADLLFGVQIVFAVIFGVSYAQRATQDVAGTSVAQFGLVLAFLAFSLALAAGAHRKEPTRASRQVIATYVIWIALVTGMILAAWNNPDYHWSSKDTTFIEVAALLTVAVSLFGLLLGKGPRDAMMKALLAITYKAVPQAMLVWKFLDEGSSGTPLAAIVVGHITITVRLCQICFMGRGKKWDRDRLWLFVNEAANELSWIIATIVWWWVAR